MPGHGLGRADGYLFCVLAENALHRGETADTHGRDGGFGAAANHHLGITALDNFERVADGVGRGRARRRGGRIRPARPIADRDVARGQVDDCGGNEERRDLAGAALQQLGVLALDNVESSDARGHVYASGIRDLRGDFEAGHLHRKVSRRQGDLDEPADLLQLFFLNPVQRIEVLHLAGDAAVESVGIKLGNRADAGLAGLKSVPGFFSADPAGANQTHTRYHDPAIQRWYSPVWIPAAGGLLLRLGVFLDVRDGVFDRGNLLGVFIGNLDADAEKIATVKDAIA